MSDFHAWAQRRQSRGGHPDVAPSAPAPRAQQTLPPPPPGHAWGWHSSGQYILVPLATPAAPPSSLPALQPPVRQPSGVAPYARPQFGSEQPPGSPSKAVETCALVKPDARDTYAELLAQIPDIVPDTSPYDAMAGNPSPQTIAEMAGVTEFAPIVSEPAQTRSFLPGAALMKGSMPLRGTG